jgi:hypothetical protein
VLGDSPVSFFVLHSCTPQLTLCLHCGLNAGLSDAHMYGLHSDRSPCISNCIAATSYAIMKVIVLIMHSHVSAVNLICFWLRHMHLDGLLV